MLADKNITPNTLKVYYPSYFPAVALNCPQFPPLHVSKYCQYPGLMVEVSE